MVYHRLGFHPAFLILLIFVCSHQAASSALPAVRQTVASNTIPFGVDVNNSSSNDLSTTPRVENVIEALIRWMRSQQDIRYCQATLRLVGLRVDNNPQFLNPTMSSDIRRFRRLGCLFRYGGPPAPPGEPDGFEIQNQWPQHWNQWNLRPIAQPGMLFDELHTISFEQAARRLSVDWADHLLKAHGFRGRYGEVLLVQLSNTPLGWCFGFLELGGDVRGGKLVTIATGEIIDVPVHCTLENG
ncbi:MAG: hypothetical protein Q9199_003723 [Rusavskia elegans]